MKRQRSVRTKLFLCFGFLVFAATVASVYSLATVAELRGLMNTEISGSALRLDQSRRITIALANMRTASRGVSLFAATNPQQLEKARALFEASARDMQQTAREMKAGQLTEHEKEIVGSIETGVNSWLGQFPEFVRLNVAGRGDEATQHTLKYVTPIMDSIQKVATEFGQANLQRENTAVDGANAGMARNEIILKFFLAVVFLAGAVGFFTAWRLVQALGRIAVSVAAGAEQVRLAASQLSASSQTIAQGASEQAAALEETSASTEEIAAMARRNTESSRSAASIVASSENRFASTTRVLDQMVIAMAEINQSSGKISKIIKVIDEIAFQTNILALNAAVEAARAGEAGMGFAVVADEVRNLAQRSAQAAHDTTALIEESIGRSKAGKSRVDEAAAAMGELGQEAQQVKTLVDDVNLGSQEQARGIEQIGKAISQIEQVTQSASASSEENAAAAMELNRQSVTLGEVVEDLSALVRGRSGRA
ncbi:MAG TPA: methyl-accepting chemotaxis protein [Bryobacteraceae bacterium]